MRPQTSATLENFKQTLRDYQTDVILDAEEFVQGGFVFERRLYACPTGTGKGTIQLALLKRLRASGYDAWILTPSLEVLRGALQRCGVPQAEIDEASPEALAEMGRAIYTTTPTRYQNGVLRGDHGMPDVILYDEAHHAVDDNEVSGTLFALAPEATWIGFSATPYRGTPAGTKALREAWGEPILVMDIPEAIDAGYMAHPSFTVVPLVDDDVLKVVGGKFVQRDCTRAVKGRLEALADLVEEVFGEEDRNSIVVTVPGTNAAGALVSELERRGVGARLVLGTTPAKHRATAYQECEQGLAVLVSVAVLTEGVDLPFLNVLIDARPTISPVEWIQRVGRIMRPKADGRQARYICVCRNLERHAYLMGGAVPREAIKQAQEAFEKPTKRDGVRSLGFEALSRFKKISIPLDGGITGSMFLVYSMSPEGVKTEWAVLTTPHKDEALVAVRDTQVTVDAKTGERSYENGKWRKADLPDDLAGWATSKQTGSLSKKQKAWWERSARRYGLDGEAADNMTRRQFAALPILSGLGVNILG